MPIKRYEESIKPRFPRLGKLRKGAEKTGEKPGEDLQWFRFTSDRPEVEAAFYAAYGKEPAVINVFLPFAEVKDNFSYWQEEWSAGGLVHRCDGEVCAIWRQEDGTYSHEPVPCPSGCKEVGRLEVIIPELFRDGEVGYVTMETKAKNDIMSILASLMETADRRRGHPDGLKGIMFVLRRVPESISTPPWTEGDDRRMRVVKWLVKLTPAAEWVRLQLEAAHARAMGLEGGEALSLSDLVGDNSNEVTDGGAEEVVNGEYTTVKPPGWQRLDPGPAQPQKRNGKIERPMDPVTLKNALLIKAGDDDTPATEKQPSFVARKFQETFAPAKDAEKRYHLSLSWLWGVDSAKDLTKHQAMATLDWLLDPDGPDDTGDTKLHKHAPDEANRVYRAALKDQG